ncbi:MAG: DUF2723 domain-containing protein [Actinomycetota bacterium]
MNKNRVFAAVLMGLASLVLFSITLDPDVQAHDSGEWQAVADKLGVSHPPGSPLYALIGWLFTLVPFGSVAGRVTFVSAVVGAAGVSALFVLMMLILDRWLPAIVAAASLAVAGLWWSHASVATPYNGIPAMIALLLILLVYWQRRGSPRLVWAGALLFGLGMGYHPSLVFFLPVLLAGVVVLGPWRDLLKLRTAIITVLLFAMGLSVYAYLPIRSAANPEIMYEKVDSLSSLVRYVTAGDQREAGEHGFITFLSMSDLKDRFTEVVRQGYYPSYAFLVFGPAVVLFYPAVWPKLKMRRRLLIYLGAGMFAHMLLIAAISGLYAQYYMPLLLYFSIWAGFSIWLVTVLAEEYLPEGRVRLVPIVLAGTLYLGVLALGMNNVWDFVNHRHDRGMRNYADWVYDNARPNAVVLAEWNTYAGLLYLQKIEGRRPDIKLVHVDKDWKETMRSEKAIEPGAHILVSLSLPHESSKDMIPVGGDYYLSIKGRTYQDRSHGEPYPLTVRLYDMKI